MRCRRNNRVGSFPAKAAIGKCGGSIAGTKERIMPTIDKIDPPIIEEDHVRPAPRDGRGDPPIVTDDTARQGPPGYRVLYVLIFGTLGAFGLMALAYLWFS